MVAALFGAPARADDPGGFEDLLGGFEDEEESSADDELGGFDDEEEPAEEDELGGFDDEEAGEEAATPARRNPLRGDFYALTGSLSMMSAVGLIDHRSAAGNTQWGGLNMLRTRLNLELDLDLPFGWEFRGSAFGFYDWAYLIRGRDEFTRDVKNKNEWDAEPVELWLRGSPFQNFDAKIGRQVLNWGRSETFRVLDVLNPLDNRVPAIADIEDLRRTVGMARFDTFLGDWSLTAVAIPEIRFDQNPVPGSDFSPLGDPVPGQPDVFEIKPDSFENWEVGVNLTGIFAGWDASLQFVYHYDDLATLYSLTPSPRNGSLFLHHARLWQVGSGANYTLGSFLFKAEIAYVDGVAFTDAADRSRLDVMGGIEYYGFTDTTITLEVLNRHTFDFPSNLTVLTNFFIPIEDDTQLSLRVSRSFLREKLDTTILGVLIRGDDQPGGIIRVDGSYELREALVLTSGFVFYLESDLPPLSTWGDNHRFFFELKWSF